MGDRIRLKCYGKDLGMLYYSPGAGIFEFRYSPVWLAEGFPLCPSLPLRGEKFQSERLWGPFRDASPEGWGQKVLQVAEYYASLFANREQKILGDFDFFVRADNFSRQGAIEVQGGRENSCRLFGKEDLIWGQIKDFAGARTSGPDTTLALLRRGVSSGGARPKVNIVIDGELWLAKPKSSEDIFNVPLWESVNLSLARMCGLEVPATYYDAKVEVLLTKRFDREDGRKVHFASARTLLGLERDDVVSYADMSRRLEFSEVEKRELFSRLVLNICVCNFDDHLCNTGFLHDGEKFRLSPLYDVQTILESVDYPWHHMEIFGGSHISSPENALSCAGEMGLEHDWAVARIEDIRDVVHRHWEEEAELHGAREDEIDAMQRVYRRFLYLDTPSEASCTP